MKRIKLLFAAIAAMAWSGVYAQTDTEYADANAEIQANGVYKIYTQSNGSSTGSTKYYLKTDGYLTDDASAAGQFTFDFQRIFGGYKMGGYRINRFTNGGNSSSSSTLSDDAKKHIIVSGTQNRTNWEAQVFFKNSDGYAIRSTNSTGTAWGASAFWTVVADNDDDGLPNATYTFDDVPFVWQLEKITDGDYSDVTAKWIVNYEPNTAAKEEGWTVTQGTKMGDWDGHNFSNDVAEFYRRSGGGISQTVNDLPAGYYTFTAIASARANSGGTISANGNSKDIISLDINNTSSANSQFTSGNGVNTIDFALEETSNVTFALTAGTSGDAWTVYRCFYLTYSSGPVALRKALAAAKESASAALTNASYSSVTGYERTQLTASIAKTIDETGKTPSQLTAAYNELIDEINNNLTAFTSAVSWYAQLVGENARAAMFGIAAQTTTEQSAKDACDIQTKAVYNYVTTNYNTPIDLGAWTTNNAGNMSSQHWSGNGSTTYNEQLKGWGGNTAWTTSYSQDIVLPAGDYVFKVAGRHSQNSTLELVVKKGETELGKVSDFPIGDTGRGIATNGTATFSDDANYANGGTGRGWQWRYVPFTISEESATINISVQGGGGEDGVTTYEWLSFCNYTVQSAPSIAASTVAYNQAKEAAEAARDNTTYANVQGTDRSGLEAAIAADKGSTIESIDAATAALQSATSTFTAAKASWDNLVNARANVSGVLPYASTDKKTALDAAVATEVTGAAADAQAQVAVIEQANRQYVESNALAEGVEGAENKTSLIVNPNADENTDGWSGEFGRLNGEQYTQGDGTLGGYYFDKNGASSYAAEQTIADLAPGKYLLTVTARAQSGVSNYKVKAVSSLNEEYTEDIPAVGNSGGVFGRGFNDASVEFDQKLTGDATIGITASQESNFWLSFDRVRLVKLRDLTPEEAAIAPTAIALYDGETEVTAPISLDKTTSTVTLTPVYTPAHATPGVYWETSDASVATVENGVVTAVSTGTATITVTSTLASAVTATATINVSFPETEVAEYTNEGATRYVHHYGENLIKNGSFEYTDGYYGWTDATTSANKLTSSNFSIITDGDNHYLQGTQNQGSTSAGSIGTAWPIENGKTYIFSYKVKNEKKAGNTDYQKLSLTNSLGNETKVVSTTTATSTSWTTVTYEFTNDENYAYVQFRARWLADANNSGKISFDDFYLVEKTADNDVVGNVQYALDAIPTANIGTGAFQYSQAAIEGANALVQGTASVPDVEAAYEAVTTLNVPAATQAYNFVFNCEGHSANGNALTLIPNPSQTQGLYGLKYLTPANVNLAQAFYFVHTTGNKYKVFAIDTDLNERYITTQAEGYGTTWYEGIRTIDDASKAMEIEIRPNGEGLYLLWNTGANKAIAHNGDDNNDMFTNNTANFQFVETSKPSITINTTAAGWGTVMLPFAATLPGVTAYTCAGVKENGKTLEIVEVESSDPGVCVLEPNKPYIIEGNVKVDLTGDAQGTTLEVKVGWLTGVYASQLAPAGSYVLQKNNDVVGFYQVADAADKPTVPANHAYLTVPSEVKALAFFFDEGTATAIQSVFNGVAAGEIYDLSGRKLNKLQKGVNIVNGKKVMVK